MIIPDDGRSLDVSRLLSCSLYTRLLINPSSTSETEPPLLLALPPPDLLSALDEKALEKEFLSHPDLDRCRPDRSPLLRRESEDFWRSPSPV